MDQVWLPRCWEGATGAVFEEQPGLCVANTASSSGSGGPAAGHGRAPQTRAGESMKGFQKGKIPAQHPGLRDTRENQYHKPRGATERAVFLLCHLPGLAPTLGNESCPERLCFFPLTEGECSYPLCRDKCVLIDPSPDTNRTKYALLLDSV